MLGGDGSTVKFVPLLATPATVTTTLPEVAPEGSGTVMLVSLQIAPVATVPLNEALLVPCVEPKFDPVIVTDAPTGADVGLTLVMAGGGITMKFTPLLATPLTVTTTGPVVAPLGTNVVIFVEVQLNAADATPLNETSGAPWGERKLVPVIVTELVTRPEVGFRPVMPGGGAVTMKFTPLLLNPPESVTVTGPVGAPGGTGTVILVSLQLTGVPNAPLNVTMLVPWRVPK